MNWNALDRVKLRGRDPYGFVARVTKAGWIEMQYAPGSKPGPRFVDPNELEADPYQLLKIAEYARDPLE